jgi:ionotropic glutamate receptor
MGGSRIRSSCWKPAITPPLMERRWPFLIQMANDGSAQIKCIADIVKAYKWKRVVVIYEDDVYDSDWGMSALLLSKALQDVDSEIEYRLVLPPSSPQELVLGELLKLRKATKSRVFIVLQSSLSMVAHLFREADKVGLIERDSAWIMTDSVTSLLDSVDDSVISSMQGALGIKTYYFNATDSYKDFYAQFSKKIKPQYPKPGIHALRAYDSIRAISQAIEIRTSNSSSAEMLLRNIVSSSFSGLSGEISFEAGKPLQTPPLMWIVNVVDQIDKRYEEFGPGSYVEGREKTAQLLDGASIIWPGNLRRGSPKGWVMPTDENPLKIVVPSRTSFQKFVKVNDSNKDDIKYGGWCIEVFKTVLSNLSYTLPYEFMPPFHGTYDELVYSVSNKVSTLKLFLYLLYRQYASSFIRSTQQHVPSGYDIYFGQMKSNLIELAPTINLIELLVYLFVLNLKCCFHLLHYLLLYLEVAGRAANL